MSFRSETKHLRVLPILKLYLLKACFEERERDASKDMEVCYFFLVLTILSVVEVPLFPQ